MEEPLEIDKWKRISVLGSGAFGIVTLWQDTITNEYIAIKKCKFQTETSLSVRQRNRWQLETENMKNLKHDNIVAYKPLPCLLATGLLKYNPTGLPLMSMEYCSRGNLRHLLSMPKNSCGLPECEVRAVLGDVSGAVLYLHRFNITHRDIKPENIVLQNCSTRKSGIICKLIDLGYAKELNDATVSFVGTLHYLAPEIMLMENYNYSVDYWSLGILTFEVVCGVLPFLPYMTPMDRFHYIEKKSPEHICIYQMYSGSVSYSAKLFDENHITSCLKQELEPWLRHMLEFDPKARSERFADNTSVFENLLNVLKKTIITVFSVPTLEFYSYEINDSTLVGTLKDWIARDINVTRPDQVLLTSLVSLDVCDEKLVVDILAEDDLTVYVVKKGVFINRDTFTLPKYIKVLLENRSAKFNSKEIKNIYSKCLFFLWQQNELVTALGTAFALYVSYVKKTSTKAKLLNQDIYKITSNLLIKSECYFNLRSSVRGQDLGENYAEYCQNFMQLTVRVEEVVSNVNNMINKVDIFTQRQIKLDKHFSEINSIIKEYSVSENVERGAELLIKGVHHTTKSDLTTKDMAQIVNEVIKFKHKLLTSPKFVNYSKATSMTLRDVDKLLAWMTDFKQYIKQLCECLDTNERENYRRLKLHKPKSIIEQINSKPTNNYIDDIDAHTLIKENQALRYKVEEVLSQAFLSYKEFSKESNDLFARPL